MSYGLFYCCSWVTALVVELVVLVCAFAGVFVGSRLLKHDGMTGLDVLVFTSILKYMKKERQQQWMVLFGN